MKSERFPEGRDRKFQILEAVKQAFSKFLVDEALLYFPDFPVKGVLFKDASAILANPVLLRLLSDAMAYDLKKLGWEHDFMAG